MAKHQLPFLVNGIVRTAAIIYVALSGWGALALAWTYVAGEIAHLVFTLWFFKSCPVNRPTKDYLKSYTVFALPIALVAASSIIMSNIDRVLIQLFWNSEDVGYYFAAYRLSHFINLATVSIGMLIFPTFSQMHSNGAMDQIKKLLRDAERHLSLIVFPMVFGLIVLSEPVAYILLSGWMPAAGIIQILTIYALLYSLALPYEAQFNGMNKPKINRDRIVVMVVSNVILNLLLIPKDIQSLGGIQLFGLGAKGAAIATVISYVISLIYTRIKSYQLLKDKGNPRILLHAFAAGGMSIILYLMLYKFYMILFITRWYHLLFFAALGLTIYLSILVILKEFTRDDFWFYIDALNIKKMVSYIKNELINRK